MPPNEPKKQGAEAREASADSHSDPYAATVNSGPHQVGDAEDDAAQLQRTTRYDVGDSERVGRGGIGNVVATRDAVLRRRVALKRLNGDNEAGFVREVRIGAQLDHPAIVPIFDLVRDGSGALCAVMRLIDGDSLAIHLARAPTLEARLRLLPSFLQVCHALAYAHRRGVVHLDLKPHNVMMAPDGQTSVIDWGLARAVGKSDNPVDISGAFTLGVAGTPAYMSPEQALGSGGDQRSDVWGLGAVLYELLTGQPPWGAPSVAEAIARARAETPSPVRSLCPDAPPALVAICEKALRRKAEERYPSAIELAADVEAWLGGRAVSARRRSAREVAIDFLRRNPWPVAAGTFALLCLVISVAVVGVRVKQERDQARQLSRVFARVASRGIEPLPENQPLLQAFTDATERYYAGLGSDVTDSDRVDLAIAWERLGRIHQRMAHFDEARAAASRSLELSRAVVAKDPSDAAAQESLVGTLVTLANIANLEGRAADELALRTEAVRAIDAAPMRASTEPGWLNLRAVVLVQWLYLLSESKDAAVVPPERVVEATELAVSIGQASRAEKKNAMLLDTWLAEERWRRGQLAEARDRVAAIDAASEKLLSGTLPTEFLGVTVYGLLVAGTLSAWAGSDPAARQLWLRADRAASAIDLSQRASLPVAGERARVWLAQGRYEEAATELHRIVKAGLPVAQLERFASLLAGQPRPATSGPPVDALDAFATGLYDLREGRLGEAAAALKVARRDGLSRQLFSVPGMMGHAVQNMPAATTAAAARFARDWDEAAARGEVASLDAALEAFASALAP
ncbi:MAG: High-affnity carbon uptake protein Hat/HatR [Myxococcaceae bacterium]|nr:High-affnity carbon uptake protein Hat/HatR [Myxococcaceae bacterium]